MCTKCLVFPSINLIKLSVADRAACVLILLKCSSVRTYFIMLRFLRDKLIILVYVRIFLQNKFIAVVA